ncbi:MAG: RNA polymerase sigma factor [Pseudomonadota bacterium]
MPRPQETGDAVASDLKADLIALLPRLRRFARSMTRSVPEADDLVQEACLRALARADQWDRGQPLDRWMFRITRNLWISEVRKRSVRLGQGHVPAEDSDELHSTETGEAALATRDIAGRIAALPGELSSVLLAVSVEGYSYAEAAELFDIPIGTVMSRIYRARKSLAGLMDRVEGA